MALIRLAWFIQGIGTSPTTKENALASETRQVKTFKYKFCQTLFIREAENHFDIVTATLTAHVRLPSGDVRLDKADMIVLLELGSLFFGVDHQVSFSN